MNGPTDFPMSAYLRRLGLSELPPPSVAGLHTLVTAQNHAIAFENLDVLAGQPLGLDAAALCDKILTHGRGGYCFELNGLLGLALAAAGFEVRPLLARVSYGRPGPGPRTHLLQRVRCEGRDWLADAGFGAPGLTAPAEWGAEGEDDLDESPFEQDGARLRLCARPNGVRELQIEAASGWTGLYYAEPWPVLPVDIQMGHHFVSTWPGSPFRQRFMCQRHAPGCSWSIEGQALVCRDRRLVVREQRLLDGPQDLAQVLAERFGLDVPAARVDAAWSQVCRHAPLASGGSR